jgi:ribosomal protein S18 acetylase RimI-like enzyme
MGEDLTGRGLFDDQKLFGYLFCLYYPIYEPQNCFIAVDKDTGQLIGYIIGTDDSEHQYKQFRRKMIPRIVLRLLSITWWKYPESYRIVRYLQTFGKEIPIEKEYPAHLHINILPEYQRKGIGSRMIERFEKQMLNSGVTGIHLGTSSRNVKAIPFYEKHGYRIIKEQKGSIWPDESDIRSLFFAKNL